MSNAVPDLPDERQLADRLTGKAKRVLGTVVGDDDLKAEGQLQTAKADAAAQARKDADEAARETAKADIEARANELRTERAQIAAEQAEAIERERLERLEAAGKAKVESAAKQQETAVQRQAVARKAAVDAKQARALRDRLDAEAVAHRIERSAQEANRNAAALGHPNPRSAGALVTQIATLPRTAFIGALDAMRLPLSTIEKLSGQAENNAWPPALMFEDFQAGVKQLAGVVFRDQTLLEEGRVQSAKVRELRRSIELDLKARATRESAAATLTEQQQAAERERQRVEEQTRAREADVARRKREAEAKVQAEAERAAEAVAQVDDRRSERLAATERASRLATADVESTALAKQKKAVASIEKVAKLDKAVDAKKAKRKNS